MGDVIDIRKETEEEMNFETDFDFENDSEFAALFNSAFSKECDDAGITVSDDLIARTMQKINALGTEEKGDIENNNVEKLNVGNTTGEETKIVSIKKKPMRWAKVAAGIAAAAFIGVVGLAVVRLFPVSRSDKMSESPSIRTDNAIYFSAESSSSEKASSDRVHTDKPKMQAAAMPASEDVCEDFYENSVAAETEEAPAYFDQSDKKEAYLYSDGEESDSDYPENGYFSESAVTAGNDNTSKDEEANNYTSDGIATGNNADGAAGNSATSDGGAANSATSDGAAPGNSAASNGGAANSATSDGAAGNSAASDGAATGNGMADSSDFVADSEMYIGDNDTSDPTLKIDGILSSDDIKTISSGKTYANVPSTISDDKENVDNSADLGYTNGENELSGLYTVSFAQLRDILNIIGLEEGIAVDVSDSMTDSEKIMIVDSDYRYAVICTRSISIDAVYFYKDRIDIYAWPLSTMTDEATKIEYQYGNDEEKDNKLNEVVADIVNSSY